MTAVAITENLGEVSKAVAEALDLLGVGDSLFAAKKVVVKPNVVSRPAAAVTQPDTLRAVIRYLKKFHPKEIIVAEGSAHETPEIFALHGLDTVIEEEGVSFIDLNHQPLKEIPLPFSRMKKVKVHVLIAEHDYDTLISLAQHKLHLNATATLSMKNIAMSYPAGEVYGLPRYTRSVFHRIFWDLHQFIAAMCAKFPPELSLIVGHPSMIGTGPTNGIPKETGLVIASQDFVTADAVGAKLFGFNLLGVRYIWEAHQRHLGNGDLEEVEFRGLPLEKAIALFKERAYTSQAP